MKFKILIFIAFINSISISFSQSQNLNRFKQSDYDIISKRNLFADIDFYNANEITLTRELNADEVTAENGVLKIINNVRYEYITLPKKNIGRYSSSSGYKNLRISFDARHPEKNFQFEMMQSKDGDNLFYLSTTTINGKVMVFYAGKYYYIVYGPGYSKDNTNYVFLLYDNTKEFNKTTENDTLLSFPSRKKN